MERREGVPTSRIETMQNEIVATLGEKRAIPYLGQHLKKPADVPANVTFLEVIRQTPQGGLVENLDHKDIQDKSEQTREKHWEKIGGTQEEKIQRWALDTVQYISHLRSGQQLIITERLGITMRGGLLAEGAEQNATEIKEKLYDRYFKGKKANIAAFAEQFLSSSPDIVDRAIDDLAEIRDLLGIFMGGEGAERKKGLGEVEKAIAAHMLAIHADKSEKNKKSLMAKAEQTFRQAPREVPVLIPEQPLVAEPATPAEPAPLRRAVMEGLTVGEREQSSELSYTDFQRAAIEKELAEFQELQHWIQEHGNQFTEIDAQLGNANVTGKGWSADYEVRESDQDIEIIKIGNSENAFTVEGIDGLPWHQVGIREGTFPVELRVPKGLVKVDLSGFVGVVEDEKGNVLVACYQGPFMNTDKHLVVRSPLQTSAKKFALLQQGDMTKDRVFVDVISMVYGENEPFKKFLAAIAKGEVAVWPLAPVNENRIQATNLGVKITVRDTLREVLTKNGQYRWISKKEVDALSRAGLLNSVAASAFSAAS